MRVLKGLLLVAVLAVGVVAFYGWVPYGPSHEVFVEIAPGTGTARMAAELERAGVVRSRYAFEALRAWKSVAGGGQGAAQTLKAGEYRFDHAATLGEVYERLRRGDVFTLTVVVPEGFNVFDVAGAVAAAGVGVPLPAGSGFASREGFLRAERQHTELVRAWSPQAESVEGYLFPETYRFSRHATAVQMLTAMTRQFGVEAARLGLLRAAAAKGESVERVVTMASLVEKEVHVDAERPVVAGVFENRLRLGMPLQTDPAVVYASLLRGTWTGLIHRSELKSDSAYNTYAHAGLPPGPICNPGVAALKAALDPAQTEYLYFVADAKGATRFSATLAEHEAKVAEYRRSER